MKQEIMQIALVVNDYDEAIQFYTQKLQFTLIEDTALSDTKRWVLIAPPGAMGCRLLLAKASTEEQRTRAGNQTGGRVFLFLHTDDIGRDYSNMSGQGIEFIRTPAVEPYGTVAVFKDLYGNLWDLIEPKNNRDRFADPYYLNKFLIYLPLNSIALIAACIAPLPCLGL